MWNLNIIRGVKVKKMKRLICLFIIYIYIATLLPETIFASENQYWPTFPEVLSPSVVVMEANTGTVLYDKNGSEKLFPASITKILTTLIAIENSNMEDVVTFSKDSIYNTEGSGIARDVDEQMTMEQCLYAVMLASANECAYAVAEHVAGDIGSFVKMMNERAVSLGCKNTNFNNCNGLPDESHYTTAYDMALIAREAYKNETFRIICGTKTYTIPFTNKHTDEETYLQNHHGMLYPLRTRNYLYEFCTGGKTGYTVAANNTLVTYAEKDGMSLICVVMNTESPNQYTDTKTLFDFCFDNFKIMNVEENETGYTNENTDGGGDSSNHEPFVSLDKEGSIVLPMATDFISAESKVVYNEKDESIAGRIEYYYADRVVGGANIIATDAAVTRFPFHNEKDVLKGDSNSSIEETEAGINNSNNPEEKKLFQINLRVIFGIIGVILLAILVIFCIRKLSDKFYMVKRRFVSKKKEKPQFKVIKKSKDYRRKRRKR